MFESFIQSYGYYAVFLFACIEGEIAVLTAGFLCKKGLLSLQMVVLAAFLGTLIAEQSLYFVGRIYGQSFLQKYPKIMKKSERILDFLRKYDAAFIFLSRFIYGIRNISPIVIGISGIKPIKFSSLNIPAAIIWSVLVAGAGYLFADALDVAKEHMKVVQIIALILFVIAVVWFLVKKTKKKIRKNRAAKEKEDNCDSKDFRD